MPQDYRYRTSTTRILVGALIVFLPLFVSAQDVDESAPSFPETTAKILLLGTFHFKDAGLDGYRPKFDVDILSAERQVEVRHVVERLAAFGPTKVAVERPPARQAALDQQYEAYRDGKLKLSSNEIHQIGFRLADQLDHQRVHAVDAKGRNYEPFVSPDQYAIENRQLAAMGLNWTRRYNELYSFSDARKMRHVLADQLLYLNDEENLLRSHGRYLVGSFKVGSDNEYPGVDSKTAWFNRNLRIFANLQRITEQPDERILLIIGAGHVPILRHSVMASPEYELVEAAEYLGSRDEDGASTLSGIWQSAGYHLVLAIEGQHYKLYETTPVSGLKVRDGTIRSLQDELEHLSLSTDGTNLIAKLPFTVAPIVFDRVGALPEVCQASDEQADDDPLRTFDIAWHTFNDNYAFFDLRNVDWEAQRETYRAKLTAESSKADVFDVLASLLGMLGDSHVLINAEGYDFNTYRQLPDVPLVGVWQKEFESQQREETLYNFVRQKYREYIARSGELIAEQMIGEPKHGANEQIIWEMLPGEIGYLRIGAMAGYVEEARADGERPDEARQLAALAEAVDRAMEDLQDARAMIVDVRFNGGGWDTASLVIAARFTDSRREAFSKKARTHDGFTEPHMIYVEPAGTRQFTRPVVLVTSPRTASAAEIFTFCMTALPHVTQAGLPTMGVHSDMQERHLPNGWTFYLSNEVYQTPAGEIYEKVGIPPEIEIPMLTPDDFADGREQVLAQAVEILEARLGDE